MKNSKFVHEVSIKIVSSYLQLKEMNDILCVQPTGNLIPGDSDVTSYLRLIYDQTNFL